MVNQLDRDNNLVLDALQATLGLISNDMRGVAVKYEGDGVKLYFALRKKDATIVDDIDDIAFELDAILGGAARIEKLLYVGAPDNLWSGRQGRLIYLAKEDQ